MKLTVYMNSGNIREYTDIVSITKMDCYTLCIEECTNNPEHTEFFKSTLSIPNVEKIELDINPQLYCSNCNNYNAIKYGLCSYCLDEFNEKSARPFW